MSTKTAYYRSEQNLSAEALRVFDLPGRLMAFKDLFKSTGERVLAGTLTGLVGLLLPALVWGALQLYSLNANVAAMTASVNQVIQQHVDLRTDVRRNNTRLAHASLHHPIGLAMIMKHRPLTTLNGKFYSLWLVDPRNRTSTHLKMKYGAADFVVVKSGIVGAARANDMTATSFGQLQAAATSQGVAAVLPKSIDAEASYVTYENPAAVIRTLKAQGWETGGEYGVDAEIQTFPSMVKNMARIVQDK